MTDPLTTSSAQPADALASGLRRTEIQHRTSSVPGRDIVQVRTEIPDGVASGWHTGCLIMRMMCDAFLIDSTSQGASGWR